MDNRESIGEEVSTNVSPVLKVIDDVPGAPYYVTAREAEMSKVKRCIFV